MKEREAGSMEREVSYLYVFIRPAQLRSSTCVKRSLVGAVLWTL
ncbi:hypothetical protein SBDP1_1740005 [Syntrophobacter sp. SbD1]|nr:hypothetical protein SBDP1_1740005 [Syntrophobacter sp. SbD1]